MGPLNARTTTVNPAAGPDFELPFVCGTSWTASTRSGHSPSYYTVDFNAPNDLRKPVLASAPGVVVKAVSLTYSYGKHVVVDHGNGYTTLYAHLRNITTSVGTFLDQGDLIGYLGSTGNSTGPHLHFEERRNGAYFSPYFNRKRLSFGSTLASRNCNDRPVAGDWNGDGKFEVGTYRGASTRSIFVLRNANGSHTRIPWGGPHAAPLTGDWNRNKVTDLGERALGRTVFNRRWPSGKGIPISGVGSAIDTPVTGDWEGNGQTDLGVYRASTHEFLLRERDGSYTRIPWGADGDRAVTGDWNKDGKTEVGTFNSATGTWTLRVRRTHAHATRVVAFGKPGDLPVTGDWNGDGTTDLGTWTPSTATFTFRTPRAGGYALTTLVDGNRRR